jgi:phage-related tail fiber protein
MPQIVAIHTTAGLALLAQAQGEGALITLGDMAVGDGGGAPITPDPAMAGLAGEVFRAAINRVYQPDPVGQPTKYAAELVIPAATGAFVMREVGLFTDDGTLFVVGNLPETYKPVPADGAFSDTLVRIEFLVANAGTINLTIDPAVVTATTAWVINYVDGQVSAKFATDPQAIAGVSTDTIMSPHAVKLVLDQAVNDLVAGAPEALNTLSEIADAIANDENYSDTVANLLKPTRARRAYLGGR